jgi:predicted RNase H-like HicB family nuclease
MRPLKVIHRRYGTGWLFSVPTLPGVEGGGRSYEDSVEAAVHAVRQHFAARGGEPPPLEHEVTED